MIIEIEGIDGAGKTLQCRLLKNWLETNSGRKAVIVKDLESTMLGRKMKELLVSESPRSKQVELFAFLCCKANLMSEVIEHELKTGTFIICDRGVGSFLSYFEVNGFDRDLLKKLIGFAVPTEYKSTTIFLDVSVETASTRNNSKATLSKFDGMGNDFFEKQRNAFLRLAEENLWEIIDGHMGVDKVHESITNFVLKKM